MLRLRVLWRDGQTLKMSKPLKFLNDVEALKYTHKKYGKNWLFLGHCYPLWGRIIFALRAFISGLFTYHYPVCCVLHYCYDVLRDIPSGAVRHSTKTDYVECKWYIILLQKRNHL